MKMFESSTSVAEPVVGAVSVNEADAPVKPRSAVKEQKTIELAAASQEEA